MSDWPLNKECFVTSITLAALKKFGLESLAFEPEILRDAFEEQFDLAKLSQKAFDKLNCGYMLVGTNAFEATIEGFLSATATMNNLLFDQAEVPFCSLEQCAWSVWEYLNLLGDIDNGQPTVTFCPDIVEYIRKAGNLNGISEFPPWLAFANSTPAMPDISDDVEQFEMYRARQQDYISVIMASVAEKQERLNKELLELKNAGYVAQPEKPEKQPKIA